MTHKKKRTHEFLGTPRGKVRLFIHDSLTVKNNYCLKLKSPETLLKLCFCPQVEQIHSQRLLPVISHSFVLLSWHFIFYWNILQGMPAFSSDS